MAETRKSRRALGRGLDALLPSTPKGGEGKTGAALSASAAPRRRSETGFLAKVEELHPNRGQPRTRFDDEALGELSDSIRELGMLEPILVRRRSEGGYEIVAGERRWRAAQRAGLFEVPVFVRELTEHKAFEAALVENLQREDLNPLETARAFQRLIDEHDRSQEAVAKLIGKDRSTVANALRLLKLPDPIMDLIEARELSEGHGRALLSAGDRTAMVELARKAVAQDWSVRETERRARAAAREGPGKAGAADQKSPNVRDLESRLSKSMGTRVTVADRKGKGHLKVAFSSYDELDRLLEIMTRG
ncbi:MAG: ParB/RepB/Spo0J family partition protein [Myxococcales bacterium]|nr:ParB/RepB/Spo0J family partition protein [Myxococcales bacterium]MDD9970631.1 ParB/RepB/Spo0J family partition protein [Myxococcales bacterium]